MLEKTTMYRKKNQSLENMKRSNASVLASESFESKTPKKSCENCKSLQSYFDLKFKESRDVNQVQNEAIMNALAEQNVLISKLIRQETSSYTVMSTFPIKTTEELDEVNKVLVVDNRASYVSAIKILIRNNFLKNIHNILTEDLINEFNVDGTHGKKRFKDYLNFYEVIKDVLGANSSIPDIESHIRKAFYLAKKRYLKKQTQQT